MTLTAATLFSGIGAPEVAMPHWDWRWHAEIEKFPSAVMAARHPNSVNLGDVTAHDFTERAAAIARPDVLVFGSPCQSFSVAGKRLGLDDPRGNLALIALGIVDRLKPRWFVFENVPGLMSSDGGRDFGTFVGLVGKLGYSLCWARLDAQHFGVAQRRERVFAVGHLGDWRYPAAVLLEPESLCGNHPPRRQAGEGVAGTLAASSGGSDENDARDRRLIAFGGNDTSGPIDIATARNAHGGPHGRLDFESETFVTIPIDMRQASRGEKMTNNRAAGSSGGAPGTGIGEPGDPSPTIASSHTPAIAFSSKDHGLDAGDIATTLRAGGHSRSHANAGVPPAVAFAQNQRDEIRMMDITGSLASEPGMKQQTYVAAVALRGREGGGTAEMSDVPSALRASNGGGDKAHVLTSAVAFNITPSNSNKDYNARESERSQALTGAGNRPSARGGDLIATSVVRRLTPRECERLQGFPDDYTLIQYRGKPAADGPRYKALGNSMPVPVIRWILNRIEIFETQVRPIIERAA